MDNYSTEKISRQYENVTWQSVTANKISAIMVAQITHGGIVILYLRRKATGFFSGARCSELLTGFFSGARCSDLLPSTYENLCFSNLVCMRVSDIGFI